MEGFTPHRPSGAADPPPQPPPYWYPPPPPPPPASSSYSVPPYHHYPPPQNQQWPPPPHYPPHAYPSAPPSHAYPPAPPPPMPPHQMPPPYPPPTQAWPNQPWPPNQGHHYPAASFPQNEGEDWAAKAKAWAAANSTTGPVDHSYLQQNEATHPNGETPLPLCSNQHISAGVGGGIAAARPDPAVLVSPLKNYDSFSAVYQQEVPSYSSSQGPKDHQPLAVPAAQDHFYHQQTDPTYMVNYGHNTHAAAVGVAGHDSVAAPHSWVSPASGGPYPPPNLPSLPAQQYDVPSAVHPSVPLPNYGPPNIPAAAFNAPPVASHMNTELYHGDPSALTQVNQTKKSAVPSWLREEILKKKTTLGSNSSAQVGSDGGERSPEATDQMDSKSADSTKSAEEDDDEDEVEAARTAAINQEIKRILTEVLLKVTDDLFDEIATKVLSEDDMAGEGSGDPTALLKSTAYDLASSTSVNTKTQDTSSNGSATSSKSVVHDESTKGGGVLLGLSDYDTDDDDDGGDHENASKERTKQNLEPEKDNSGSLMKNDVLSDKHLVNHMESTELKSKGEVGAILEHRERTVDKKLEEESHVEAETDQASKEEILHKGFVDGNGNMEKSKVMIDGEDRFKDNYKRSKEGSGGDLRDKEQRNKEEKMDGNILKGRRQRSSGNDRETEIKDDEKNKLDDLQGSKKKTAKEEKDKSTERDSKDDKKEKSNEDKDRKMERRDDKEDSYKERRDRSREEKERRAERRDDGERSLRNKSDRSKEDEERETDKRDDKERSRRNRRSRSPRGRSQSQEHSRAIRDHSESTKRRRAESNRRSMSRSPPRSRHRRDSRSPHSKHSHHRNSAYSTTDRRRSRSRTPTRRRRSRSRTPSRRR